MIDLYRLNTEFDNRVVSIENMAVVTALMEGTDVGYFVLERDNQLWIRAVYEKAAHSDKPYFVSINHLDPRLDWEVEEDKVSAEAFIGDKIQFTNDEIFLMVYLRENPLADLYNYDPLFSKRMQMYVSVYHDLLDKLDINGNRETRRLELLMRLGIVKWIHEDEL